MTVQRYRWKPQPPRQDEGLTAARYDPPLSSGDAANLAAVAKLSDDLAEVREVTFASGKRVLLARWVDHFDEHPPKWAYTTVEPGNYLAYSPAHGNLAEYDAAGLAYWCEPQDAPKAAGVTVEGVAVWDAAGAGDATVTLAGGATTVISTDDW